MYHSIKFLSIQHSFVWNCVQLIIIRLCRNRLQPISISVHHEMPVRTLKRKYRASIRLRQMTSKTVRHGRNTRELTAPTLTLETDTVVFSWTFRKVAFPPINVKMNEHSETKPDFLNGKISKIKPNQKNRRVKSNRTPKIFNEILDRSDEIQLTFLLLYLIDIRHFSEKALHLTTDVTSAFTRKFALSYGQSIKSSVTPFFISSFVFSR